MKAKSSSFALSAMTMAVVIAVPLAGCATMQVKSIRALWFLPVLVTIAVLYRLWNF